MNRKLLALFVVLLVLSVAVFAEDVLIYGANFKGDSSDVDWVPFVGEWEEDGGYMINYDTENSNTIISQELDQSREGIYIYEYLMSYFEIGASWAPMAGLHFMASDDSSATRGDSYLMWHDNVNIQFYKCSSAGTLSLLQAIPGYPVGVHDERLVRVEFNTKTGEIKGYIDGELVIEVIDPDPIVDGSFISLRTSYTATEYDYVKVWYRK